MEDITQLIAENDRSGEHTLPCVMMSVSRPQMAVLVCVCVCGPVNVAPVSPLSVMSLFQAL